MVFVKNDVQAVFQVVLDEMNGLDDRDVRRRYARSGFDTFLRGHGLRERVEGEDKRADGRDSGKFGGNHGMGD